MFDPEDLDELARLFRDPLVMKYVGDGQPVSREETERALESIIRHWQTHGFGRWAAVDLQTQEFIGFGGLRSLFGTPEVVYHLASAHWGKGLATELARASLRFGFETHRFEGARRSGRARSQSARAFLRAARGREGALT